MSTSAGSTTDPVRAGRPLLEVAAVSKRFGRVVTADELSFEVAAGEVLGIVGPNGAGKSTLLDVVCGTQRADAGSIWFGDEDVTHVPAAGRSTRGIGRTYQVPRPFTDMTVFENALVGARFGGRSRGRAAHEAAGQALETAGLLHLANARAGQLRLLDRKRLELARALATGPRLVLLDEIAGGLTDAELPALVDVVRRLRDSGVAVVWIEHIVHALLQVVDRLMCLAGGRVLAVGDPRTVLRSPEVVATYLGTTVDVGPAAS